MLECAPFAMQHRTRIVVCSLFNCLKRSLDVGDFIKTFVNNVFAHFAIEGSASAWHGRCIGQGRPIIYPETHGERWRVIFSVKTLLARIAGLRQDAALFYH